MLQLVIRNRSRHQDVYDPDRLFRAHMFDVEGRAAVLSTLIEKM